MIAGVASQLGSEECGQLLFSGCKVSVMPDDKVLDICFQYCAVHLTCEEGRVHVMCFFTVIF